jgi:beta-galactosidase
MTVTRRSLLVAGTAAPVAGALGGTASAVGTGEGSAPAGRSVDLLDGWRFEESEVRAYARR